VDVSTYQAMLQRGAHRENERDAMCALRLSTGVPEYECYGHSLEERMAAQREPTSYATHAKAG